MSDSAAGRAKARVGSRPGFELASAVLARFHVSYCNAYFVDIPQIGWGWSVWLVAVLRRSRKARALVGTRIRRCSGLSRLSLWSSRRFRPLSRSSSTSSASRRRSASTGRRSRSAGGRCGASRLSPLSTPRPTGRSSWTRPICMPCIGRATSRSQQSFVCASLSLVRRPRTAPDYGSSSPSRTAWKMTAHPLRPCRSRLVRGGERQSSRRCSNAVDADRRRGRVSYARL
nr:MAG TPA: hypothetical protein [Caudoviricetes sp.]